MTLPLVIVNPASADGATRENWPKIASDLRTHFGPFTVEIVAGKMTTVEWECDSGIR